MQTRKCQKKKTIVEKFIKKTGKVEHSAILNEVDIDYDALTRILRDLRREGRIK
jgi:predicted transcriptional regulator